MIFKPSLECEGMRVGREEHYHGRNDQQEGNGSSKWELGAAHPLPARHPARPCALPSRQCTLGNNSDPPRATEEDPFLVRGDNRDPATPRAEAVGTSMSVRAKEVRGQLACLPGSHRGDAEGAKVHPPPLLGDAPKCCQGRCCFSSSASLARTSPSSHEVKPCLPAPRAHGLWLIFRRA